MSWLDKANEWLSRPFRNPSPAVGQGALVSHHPPGSRAVFGRGEAERAAGSRRGAVGADTDVTVRHIFSLTNPGVVKPLGEGVAIVIDDPYTLELADKVMAHFQRHRPEPASFPALATQVIDLAEQPEADLARLAGLIEMDPAISAKVLQVANSALYHRDFEIGTMKAAINHLGMFAVANVAVGVACRSLYDAETRSEFDLYPEHWKRLFQQGMTVAYASSQFCLERKIGRPDQVFLAGMFHDIGKTLALRSLAALVIARQIAPVDPVHVDRVLERTHVAVGTEAHMAWELPQFLSTICRRHHDDDVVPTPDYTELHVVRVVSGLNALRLSGNFDRALSRQVRQSVHALGITQPALRELTSSIRQAQERVSDMFNL